MKIDQQLRLIVSLEVCFRHWLINEGQSTKHVCEMSPLIDHEFAAKSYAIVDYDVEFSLSTLRKALRILSLCGDPRSHFSSLRISTQGSEISF